MPWGLSAPSCAEFSRTQEQCTEATARGTRAQDRIRQYPLNREEVPVREHSARSCASSRIEAVVMPPSTGSARGHRQRAAGNLTTSRTAACGMCWRRPRHWSRALSTTPRQGAQASLSVVAAGAASLLSESLQEPQNRLVEVMGLLQIREMSASAEDGEPSARYGGREIFAPLEWCDLVFATPYE